jgi:transcriptional regulator with XRE-family HTH domain
MKRKKIASRQRGYLMTNRKLKAAVVLEYGSQVEAARSLGWSESRLSRLINGRIEPRAEDVQLIHQKLGVDLKAENLNVVR